MAAEVSYNNAWYTFGGTLAWKNVTSKSYTPFGEQIGEQTSGFGYNGEYYNAATGMVYLRARFYEPEMNRFSQKDVVRGSIAVPTSLNRYLYVWNDPINFIDPSGEFVSLLAATAIAAGAAALISGAASAYQSWKSTGKVDWKQAGKAAAGGAVAAVAVGVAVATGGAALGAATMAIEAYAGTKAALKGGSMADVTSSMAKAGTMTVAAANILPVMPNAAKAVIGAAGMIGCGVKLANDTKKARSTFKDPKSTVIDRTLAVMDVAEDAAGFLGSMALTYSGVSGLVGNSKASRAANAADAAKTGKNDPPATDSPRGGSTQGGSSQSGGSSAPKVECAQGEGESCSSIAESGGGKHTLNPGTRVINHGEVKAGKQIKSSEVTNYWDEYLGDNQTNINPRTGQVDPNRIFSADGTRSIRFGTHEMDSMGTSKFHFHEELWEYDSVADELHYYNTLIRIK